ncbi:LysR substrate binding domain protein [compost metagenome]
MDWNDADDTGWKATHYHEVLSMVRLGLGYAWVPGHLVREELASGALVQLDLAGGSERYLYTYLLTPSTDALGPAAELLLRCLRNEYQADSGK